MTMEKIYSPALVSFHKEQEIGQEGKTQRSISLMMNIWMRKSL